jgi:AcrR family transcriptional regulator
MAEETRDRIVAEAQRLFFSGGYESTSVAQIINAVDIAKGTFYHHFGSKVELLDEIVARFTEEVLGVVKPIVDDPQLSATEKLRAFFVSGFAWKVADADRFYGLLRAIYADDNLLFRRKVTERTISIVSPLLAVMVRQGVEEGDFDTPIPDRAGELALRLATALSEQSAALFLELLKDPAAADRIDALSRDIEYAMERLIGAPAGTITVLNREDLYKLAGSVASKE